eukprot:g512.t1
MPELQTLEQMNNAEAAKAAKVKTLKSSQSAKTLPRKPSFLRSRRKGLGGAGGGDGSYGTDCPAFAKLYKVGARLGSGGFAVVKRCTTRGPPATTSSAVERAVKITDMSKVNEGMLEKEHELHAALDHPAIVRVHGYFRGHKRSYMVMDLCDEGDIASALSRESHLSEARVGRLLRAVLDGIVYLHEVAGVIHRDLKPENVLLYRDRTGLPGGGGGGGGGGMTVLCPKIADFGLAARIGDGRKVPGPRHIEGTLEFFSPELLLYHANAEMSGGDGSGAVIGKPADVWAVGVLAFMCLEGVFPFAPTGYEQREDVFRNIMIGLKGLPEKAFKDRMSPGMASLVKSMLHPEPTVRITARGAVEALDKLMPPPPPPLPMGGESFEGGASSSSHPPSFLSPRASPRSSRSSSVGDADGASSSPSAFGFLSQSHRPEQQSNLKSTSARRRLKRTFFVIRAVNWFGSLGRLRKHRGSGEDVGGKDYSGSSSSSSSSSSSAAAGGTQVADGEGKEGGGGGAAGGSRSGASGEASGETRGAWTKPSKANSNLTDASGDSTDVEHFTADSIIMHQDELSGADEEVEGAGGGGGRAAAAAAAAAGRGGCKKRAAANLKWADASQVAALVEEREAQARAAFDAYDENGDGVLDLAELTALMRDFGIFDQEQVERHFHRFDVNDDGEVDFNEFVANFNLLLAADQQQRQQHHDHHTHHTHDTHHDDHADEGKRQQEGKEEGKENDLRREGKEGKEGNEGEAEAAMRVEGGRRDSFRAGAWFMRSAEA